MNIKNITGGGSGIQVEDRAADAWRRIQDKASLIVLDRHVSNVDLLLQAQTVRVEYDNNASESESDAGRTATRKVILFGIRGHRSLPDTNVKRGDRFAFEGKQFKVVDLVLTIGEIQAHAEAQV